MRWSRILPRLRSLFSRRKAEADFDDEIESHVELQARKHIAAGLSEEEAWRRARIDLGGVQQTRESVRDVNRWRLFDAFARNLRQALRTLRKSPIFTLVAVVILAVGIGANLAVFSLVDSLLFRPLPVDRPEELVRVSTIDKQGRLGNLPSTIADPVQRISAFHGVCTFNTSYEGADINGAVESIGITGFDGNCFETLGLRVQLGRAITPADDSPGAEATAVVSSSLWHSAFGGRADVLGKRIKMAGVALTVIGVAEERFDGLLVGFPTGIILPLHQEPGPLPGSGKQAVYFVNVLARLAPGVTQNQALAALATQNDALLKESLPSTYTQNRQRVYLASKLTLTSAKNGIDYMLRNRFGKPLYAVLGICASILLIACVNLANLLLARSLRRQKEIGMRMALGAKRAHVAGMLVFESSILVLAGAGLGVLIAGWLDDLVLAQGSGMFGNFQMKAGFDSRVAAFLIGAVALIAGAFAVAAAWQSGRLCNFDGIRDGGRGVVRGSGRVQKILIACQIALTLALVAGGSLFNSSLRGLYQIDLGLNTERLWDVMLSTRPEGYNNASPGPYYRDLLHQIETSPGVASATLANIVPLYMSAVQSPIAHIENVEAVAERRSHVLLAADGYFQTLGLHMIAGEDFRRDDSDSREASAIISESLAAQFGDPAALIGHHIRVGSDQKYQRLKIVGVVSNAELDLVHPLETKPYNVYVNLWQHTELAAGGPVLLVKTKGGTLDIAAVRRIVDSKGRL